MSIEFINDEFLEGKKEELDNIEKELSKKPKKVDRNVLFLRRFTFALMGQYKIQNKHLYNKNINEFRAPIQRIMPQAPLNIPTPSGLQIPMPQNIPRPQMAIPKPSNIQEIKQLKIPEPIQISIPRLENENKEVKKEFIVPNPL